MRKLGLILSAIFVLGACSGRNIEPVPNCRGNYVIPRSAYRAQQQPVHTEAVPVCDEYYDPYQTDYQPQEAVYAEPEFAAQPYEQVIGRRNIIIREKTSYSVTYEYQEVRLDEVANYADEYCSYLNSRAFLRESLTHRNNSRLATFDCVE